MCYSTWKMFVSTDSAIQFLENWYQHNNSKFINKHFIHKDILSKATYIYLVSWNQRKYPLLEKFKLN